MQYASGNYLPVCFWEVAVHGRERIRSTLCAVSELLPRPSEEPFTLRQFLSVLLVSAVALCAPSVLFAEKPDFYLAENSDAPKVELFSGYSGYRAGGTFNTAKTSNFVAGWGVQLNLNSSKWGGLVVDYSRHNGVSLQADELAAGLRLQKPVSRFVPFGQALVGLNDIAFTGLPSQVKPVWIAGGGVDIKLTSRLSMRPIEMSYVGGSYNTPGAVNSPPHVNSLSGVRVQSGLIYNLGRPSSVGEVLADCRVEPPAVDAGVAVKIGVKTMGFPSKRKLRYTYVATGGTIAGNTATESVDTKGLLPGHYTIAATVLGNSRGKHRLSAACEAEFSVTARILPAPTPQAEIAKVSPVPSAPDGATKVPPAPSAPVETAKAPAVQESTNASNVPEAAVTAQKPTMAPEAPVESAKAKPVPSAPVEAAKALVPAAQESTNASNVPEAAVPAQKPAPLESLPPQPSKYGAIAFSRDLKRPTRVDNEAKGELDRYADALAAKPDCNGVVVGYTSAKEEKNRKQAVSLSGQRAVNTKNYLTKDKGIDTARIQPRVGSKDNQKTELWIVPAGGSFAAAGTAVVDESKVKAVPRIALKARNSKTKMRKAVNKSNLHRSRDRHRRRITSSPMSNTAHATLNSASR